MKIETLKQLEEVNQLALNDDKRIEILSFLNDRKAEFEKISSIDTSNIERMVHVIPVNTVVREDVVKQQFSREELQLKAPETDEGYWCVPKVLD